MPHRSLLVAAAAGGAFVCGVAAAVTTSDGLAVAAGVLAVLTAVLSFPRSAPTASRRSADVVVETDDEPESERPVVDPETGLYAAPFLDATLDGRVATARRVLRPLSLVLFEVTAAEGGSGVIVVDPQTIAATMRATLRESDLACRAGDNTYAMILEDTAEDGAVWTAERIRRNLAGAGSTRLFRAGVASYPNHGLDAGELHERAERALTMARDWRRDRIEVADTL